jgi:hypothetical protein
MLIAYDAASQVVQTVFSEMTGSVPGTARPEDFVVFWSSPSPSRLEFRRDTCTTATTPVQGQPMLADVLLDTIGPIDPKAAGTGFVSQDGSYVRPDGQYHYKLTLTPGGGREYSYIHNADGAVVTLAEQVSITPAAVSEVPAKFTPAGCPDNGQPTPIG